MTEDVKNILLNLVASLVDCDSLDDFEQVRSDCCRKLLADGFTDKYFSRHEMTFALIESGMLRNRGLELEIKE